jgi:hypothetical protein
LNPILSSRGAGAPTGAGAGISGDAAAQQFEITIKNKMRFSRNSDNAVKRGLVLNKTLGKSRSGTKELRLDS